MRKLPALSIFAAAAVTCMLHASVARASAAITPAGQYARIVGERAIVVWDEKNKREHLFVQLRLYGDAKAVAITVPVIPDDRARLAEGDVGPADDIAFGRLEALLKYDTTDVPDTLPVDALPIRTLQPKTSAVLDGGDPLRSWLSAEVLAPALAFEAWAGRYVFYRVAAARFVDDGATEGRGEVVQTPMLRLSFAAPEPYFPYTMAAPEGAEETAFQGRGKGKRPQHALDLWVLSAGPVDAVQRVAAELRPGPAFHGQSTLTADDVAGCLGEVPGFDPRARTSWTLTRFADRGQDTRVAFGDLTFVAAKARPGAHKEHAPVARPSRFSRRTKLATGLFLALVAIVVGAVLSQRERRSDPGA